MSAAAPADEDSTLCMSRLESTIKVYVADAVIERQRANADLVPTEEYKSVQMAAKPELASRKKMGLVIQAGGLLKLC